MTIYIIVMWSFFIVLNGFAVFCDFLGQRYHHRAGREIPFISRYDNGCYNAEV